MSSTKREPRPMRDRIIFLRDAATYGFFAALLQYLFTFLPVLS